MARTNTKAVGLEDFHVLGTRPIRHDGFEKVTGRAKYGADVDMAGLLWAAMLRSPWAHARIKSIDTSKAAALEGVRAVMVGDDLPEPLPGGSMRETHANLKVIRDNALAQDKVLYKGHAVVAIAATSFHIAEQAVGLVEVEYEILSPVLDVLSAMNKDSVLVHDDISAMGRGPGPAGTMADLPPNAASHTQFKIGDLAQGFEDADVIVERELRTKPVHQGYIEPHNSTSWWDLNGKLTVWTSTQGAFIVRQQLAHMLHLSPNDVTVVPMEIGGGFGGKIDTYMDPVTAVLSKKTGRPVKMVMSRKEVFEGTGPASGSLIRS
ncbi:molybdopterin-dependent oxidoreductase, partial [Dehalococcoidia bacterium]|nr:molybdopterin-dependent oxidoreductase [Dehalococcoidia bacterium]